MAILLGIEVVNTVIWLIGITSETPRLATL
jgi:hypothetical protein